MAEQRCPECGGALSPGLVDPVERAASTPFAGSRWDCSNCGWSSTGDRPGTEGGDNGGG